MVTIFLDAEFPLHIRTSDIPTTLQDGHTHPHVRGGNWGSEKWSAKTVLLVRSRRQSQTVWFWGLCPSTPAPRWLSTAIASQTSRFTGAHSSTTVTRAKMAISVDGKPGSLAPEPATLNHNSFLNHKDVYKRAFFLFLFVVFQSSLHAWKLTISIDTLT